ncbi:MAG TPA: ATP-dependent DNA ligase [Actinomycetota bacterium]|nr:ATP-dependent DNA ligase [Actinomycetota bacterium]
MGSRASFQPMLATLVRELPIGDGLFYEPKWDGFRCLAFVDEEGVDMRSRHGRPLARYFPEVAGALAALGRGFVLDGELIVPAGDRLDFSALLQRLHPAASRVDLLSRATPAAYVAFDVVVAGGADLTASGFGQRRRILEELLNDAPEQVRLTPSTRDRAVAARWLEAAGGGGIDGVVVKDESLRYVPGKRRMVKVKREKTADCVVGAFRWHAEEPVIGSLLLGLYDGDVLRHAGLAAWFSSKTRRELTDVLLTKVVPLAGHPWEHGFNVGGGPIGRLPGAASRFAYGGEITFVPVDPVLVCEGAYDHVDHDRFRHPLKFRRWRPDRDPRSCTYDQLEEEVSPVTELLAPK